MIRKIVPVAMLAALASGCGAATATAEPTTVATPTSAPADVKTPPAASPTAAPTPTPSTFDLAFGVVLPTVTADYSNPTDCAGTGEWADVHSGSEVIVTDAAGATLGTTSLPKGVVPQAFLPGDPVACRFEVQIGSLPKRSSYTIRIGRHELPIDLADAVQSDFTWMIP